MKKNLFLLFSIYFFVVQPLIIGILRNQTNFFRLGAINLVAIILIGMLYSTTENNKEEIQEHEKKLIKEPQVSFHDHFRTLVKERKKKSELIYPILVSGVVMIIFSLIYYPTISLQPLLVIALVVGWSIFSLLTLISKHRITKGFWTLIGTKIYLILLVVSLVLTAYDYYQIHRDYDASFEDYVRQTLLGQEKIPTNGYIFTGEGTVLGTGIGSTTGTQGGSSDVLSGMITSDIQDETGMVIGTSTDTNNEPTSNDTIATTVGNQKLMDAILYLIKKYNIPLVTKTDIHFTYVTTKNPYYNEWRTAYANKLIGTTTNPSKYIVCESYIVMKGIVEKWSVPYTSATVLTNFRAEAVKRDALNGCIKGKIVTDKTL